MTIQELIDELSKIKDKTKQIYYRDSRPDHPFGDIFKSSFTLGIKLFAKIFALSNFSVFILLSIYVRRLLNIKPYKIS